MNNWIFLALLSPAVFTVCNFIDKYILESKVKDYRGIPIYSGIVGLIAGTLFWLIFEKPILPFFDGLIVIIVGMFTVWAFLFYFKALSSAQTSYVIALFQLIPVFTLIFSFLFLHEIISISQLFGFFLILTCAILLSYKKQKKKFKFDNSFYYVLAADAFFAGGSILIKFAINANSFTKIVSYESWGIAIGALFLFIFYKASRVAFLETTKTAGNKVLGIMLFNEGVYILAKTITFLAISLGPVTLVSVLGGTQVFYGIVFGLVLTIFMPKVFKESVAKEEIIKKLVLIVFLFVGIWLIK